MPVILTFDLKGAPSAEHNRIQSFFERFGWQNLGGSSYRYPRLGTSLEEQPVENWFNHVIPALMLFRSYVIASRRELTKFSLDVQTSTGLHRSPNGEIFGAPPLPADELHFYAPNNVSFGESNLRDWLGAVTYPYNVD